MVYSIFISYAGEDDQNASYIHYCLSRIVEFQPYKAEAYPDYGADFKKRIESKLDSSEFLIVMLTNNGVRSQWVNQELGYAYALWTKKGRPRIIPISESQVELKGFVTKDTFDMLFLDKLQWEIVIAEIIRILRIHIPRGLEDGRLHVRMRCSNCRDKTGLPFDYDSPMPAHEWMMKATQSNNTILWTLCEKCGAKNHVDMRTFLPVPNP